MDPFSIALMAGGAGTQVLGGLVGFLVENGREKEAKEIMARARQNYDNLSVPKLQEIAAEVLGPTELAQIQTNPAYRAAQDDALNKLLEMEEGGGFNLEDRAALNRIQNQIARQEQAQRQQITEQMNARGVAGSGAELAMQLGNAQAAADRAQQSGLDVAAQAQRRYFDAIRGRADLAGQLRSQDWGEQSEVARAQDEINRFNWGRRFDVQQYNNNLRQQQYQNQVARADRQYGMARDEADALRNRGRREGQVISGVGGAIGGGMQQYGAMRAGGAGGSQYAAQYPDFEAPVPMSEDDRRRS